MSAEFKRVYSGGHHDVYCDGIRHFTIDGSACGTCAIGKTDGLVKIRYQFKCDCAKFSDSTEYVKGPYGYPLRAMKIS